MSFLLALTLVLSILLVVLGKCVEESCNKYGVSIPEIDMVEKSLLEFEELVSTSSNLFWIIQNNNFVEYLHHQYTNFNELKVLYQSAGIESLSNLPKSVEEIKKLPIISKSFLKKFKGGFEGDDDVMHVSQTSGTTGTRLDIPYSLNSMNVGWGELGIRNYFLIGILNPLKTKEEFYGMKKGMMITSHNPNSNHQASSYINTLEMVRVFGIENVINQPSSINLQESINKMFEEQIEWLATFPMIFGRIISIAKKMNKDLSSLQLDRIYYGGAAFPADLLETTIKEFNISEDRVFGIYPSTEHCLGGSEVIPKHPFFPSISSRNSIVLNNDKIIFEILDEDGNDVEVGETGRIIITPTFMDKIPLIRYDIGDVAQFLGIQNNFMIIRSIDRDKCISFVGVQICEEDIISLKKQANEDFTGIRSLVLVKKGEDTPLFRIELEDEISQEKERNVKGVVIKKWMGMNSIQLLMSYNPPALEFPEFEFVAKGVISGSLKQRFVLVED